MTVEIADWERANKGDLCQLAWVMRRIVDVVKGIGSCNQRAVVEYDGGMTLKVVAGDGKPALPDGLYKLWGTDVTKEESNSIEE